MYVHKIKNGVNAVDEKKGVATMSNLESKQGRWGNDQGGLMMTQWDPCIGEQDEVEVVEQARWRMEGEVKG